MASVDRTPVTNLRSVLKVPCAVHTIREPHGASDSYTSVITDFDESAVFFTEPSKGPQTLPLETGDTVRAVYYGDDAVYDFSLHVTGRDEDPRRGLRYRADIPNACWRLQRRDSFRLPVQVEAEYRMALEDPDEEPATPQAEATACLVTDISEGGVAFLVDEPLDVDACVELSFSLDGMERTHRFDERVRIVQVGPAPKQDGRDHAYRYAGSFCDIDERARNHILRYIFLRQMESLRDRRG